MKYNFLKFSWSPKRVYNGHSVTILKDGSITCHHMNAEVSSERIYIAYIISSVESQKGVNSVTRCSIENQKGAIAVQSLWLTQL